MKDILDKLERALQRMRERGHQDTVHYANLKEKYELIKAGAAYHVIDVTEQVIRSAGGLLARISKATIRCLK